MDTARYNLSIDAGELLSAHAGHEKMFIWNVWHEMPSYTGLIGRAGDYMCVWERVAGGVHLRELGDMEL